MLPLGPRPVLEHLVTHLARNGFTEQIITVNYLKEQVMRHFDDGFAFGADIKYALEPEGTFLGTAGSVKLAGTMLDDTFFVVQGDAFTRIDLRETLRFHKRSRADVTILLKRVTQTWLYGITHCDETGRIRGFQEKPPWGRAASDLGSTGIYCLEPEVLDFIDLPRCDFASDLFPRLLKLNKRLFGYVDDDYWVDIGSLQGYLEGTHEVLRMRTEMERNAGADTISSIDTIIPSSASVDPMVLIEEGVSIGGHSRIGPDAVLKEDAAVGHKTIVEFAALFEQARVGSSCHIRESIVGEKAVIGDNVIVEGSIIGPGATLEDGVRVMHGSRVWPGVRVASGSLVKGNMLVSPKTAK